MKKNTFYILSFFYCVVFFFNIACKYELVPSPSTPESTEKSPADYDNYITAPLNLKSTQGDFEKITLEWDALPNAVQYQIFSADTPFDSFVQVTETKDSSSTIEITESSGTTKYYAVKAVNYYGTISKLSDIVQGTTLSIPIITDISSSDEGNSISIEWWMDNCSKGTYENDITFTVTAYDSSFNQLKDTPPVTCPGDVRTACISGLSATTEYFFTVQAQNTAIPTAVTKSDYTNASTAHKIIPDAPLEFKAEQGINKDKVILTWKDPEQVDFFNPASLMYEKHDVCYKLYRKISGADDDGYELICPYIPFSTQLYEDSTAQRSRKYTYKLQSFTDNSGTKTFTSDKSVALADGCKLGVSSLTADSLYTRNGDSISKVDVSFDFKFDTMELEYSFLFVQIRTSMDNTNSYEPEILLQTDSTDEISSFKISYADIDNDTEGYYQYGVYILPKTEDKLDSVPLDAYEFCATHAKVTVTTELLPKINDFTVYDGYKDKFVISWNNRDILDKSVKYTLYWTPYTDGIAGEEVNLEIASEDLLIDGNTISFNHQAESGDCRRYKLTAQTDTVGDEVSLTEIFYTLGTPVPKMSPADYTKITVTWPSVQKTEVLSDFSLSAVYEDENLFTETREIITDENTSFTFNEVTNTYTCVITDPQGFDNPAVSGKPVSFKVTAKNSITKDETTAVIPVCTLGPALIDTQKDQLTYSDKISISWNKIKDAKGYIIYRPLYKYDDENSRWSIDKADTYFYDDTTELLTCQENEVSTERTKIISSPDHFTLIDYYKEADDITVSYQNNQSRISWGIPFGYIILPVNGDSSDFTFDTDENYNKLTEDSKVLYTKEYTLPETISATYGFGLNVKATKAESSTQITVEWNKPYYSDSIPTLYRAEFSKSNEYGTSWEHVITLTKDITSYSPAIANEDLCKSFVYAVQYSASAASSFSKSYIDKLNQTTDERYEFPEGYSEPEFKGYLLTIDNFKAEWDGNDDTTVKDVEYYQERISWDKNWDYDRRALAPDSFSIELLNRNLSSTSNWVKIADINIENRIPKITPVTGLEDTTVTNSESNDVVYIRPDGLTAGSALETNGLLKVLRDTRHYYSVTLIRDSYKVRQAGDYNTYAYRQITDTELAKCVSVIIADALYQASIPKGPTTNTATSNCYGKSGTFSITHKGTSNNSVWGFNNSDYVHQFIAAPCSTNTSSLVSDFTLKGGLAEGKAGAHEHKLYYLAPLDIAVTHASGLSSYEGTINFTAGAEGTVIVVGYENKKWNLTIKKNGSQIVSISNNQTDFKKWFPYLIDTKYQTPVQKVDTSIPEYQAPWWN